MQEFFDEFTKRYDMSNQKLNHKYYHSYRVMDNMELLAKSKNLSYKDIELAKCIGLFHDIGRFTQYEKITSFDDLLLDHGNIGVDTLKKEHALDRCNIHKEDYQIVYKAIKNHNKFTIDNNLNERELLFSKFIRDADKLDILYALSNKNIKKVLNEDNLEINEIVKNNFFQKKSINKRDAKSKNDKMIIVFSFIFDINFGITMDIIKTNDYYNKIYKRLKNQKLFKPYIEYINKYITERID